MERQGKSTNKESKNEKVVDLSEFKDKIKEKAKEKDTEHLTSMQEFVELEKNFEELREEVISLLENPEYKLVARDQLEARAIMKIVLEEKEDIAYCRTQSCLSRVSNFIEITPVKKSEQAVIFPDRDLAEAYLQQLLENGQYEDVNGFLVPTD